MLLTVFLILKTNHSILILVGLILTLKLWLSKIEVLKVGNTVSWQLPSTTKREFGLLLRVPFLWTGSKMSNLLWSKIASDLKKDVALMQWDSFHFRRSCSWFYKPSECMHKATFLFDFTPPFCVKIKQRFETSNCTWPLGS